MNLLYIQAICCSILFSSVCVASDGSTVEKAFIDSEIVKDIDLPGAPKTYLTVRYLSGVEPRLGNQLTPTEVKDTPFLRWNFEQGVFYSVLMIDLDAPSRQNHTFRSIRHWHVLNVPNSDIEQGDTIVEYIGSGAPLGTGLHRYVFLVFKQPFHIDKKLFQFVRNCSVEGRLSLSLKGLIEEYQLGSPEFGNFFEAEYDEYVPELQKQLGSNCM